MSYTKQTWQTGEVITADKLNHMEDGITKEEILILKYDEETNTFSHTVQECTQAMSDGKIVIASYFDGLSYEWYIASHANSNSIYFFRILPVTGSGPHIVCASFDGTNFEISEGKTIPVYYAPDVNKVLKLIPDTDSSVGCRPAWVTP